MHKELDSFVFADIEFMVWINAENVLEYELD